MLGCADGLDCYERGGTGCGTSSCSTNVGLHSGSLAGMKYVQQLPGHPYIDLQHTNGLASGFLQAAVL